MQHKTKIHATVEVLAGEHTVFLETDLFCFSASQIELTRKFVAGEMCDLDYGVVGSEVKTPILEYQ